MRLLICTQAIDRNDPVLGFFVRWIEMLSRECEHVLVICLRKGAHDLPENVEVISLGERHRISRAFALVSIAFGRRHGYDTVFVHMNPEYIVAAGWLWRILGKKIVLWYTHKSVTVFLRIATLCADTVVTASKESFRLPSRKVIVVGHGIDTDFFAPDPTIARGEHLLSVGRLMPSKRHDLAIAGAAAAGRSIKIMGEGPERAALQAQAEASGSQVEFLGGLTQSELRDEYHRAFTLIHTSETGSLDKVVLEALATDCPVITTSDAYAGFPLLRVAPTPDAIAGALQDMPAVADRVAFIREQHSLPQLIRRLASLLDTHV